MENRQNFRATVKTVGTKELSKSNNAKYVLCNCELLEGKGKGLVVPVQRTTLTKEGVVKDLPEVGQEVSVFMEIVPSKEDPKKNVFFFEMSTGILGASQDELRAIFG